MKFVKFGEIRIDANIPSPEGIIELEQQVQGLVEQLKKFDTSSIAANELLPKVKVLKDTIAELETQVKDATAQLDSIKTIKGSVVKIGEEVTTVQKGVNEKKSKIEKEIEESRSKYQAGVADIQKKIHEASNQVTTATQQCVEAGKQLALIQQREKDATNSRGTIQGYEKELATVYGEFCGNGKKKQELDATYQAIKDRFVKTKGELETFEKDIKTKIEGYFAETQKKIDGYCSKIEELFGGAVTVGLGQAYHDKCKEEKENHHKYVEQFNKSLKWLAGIGIVMFASNLFYAGCSEKVQPLEGVRYIGLIALPIIVPVLWFAFVASRKANLAKRLAEEYAHKEVVSKTFEGLSRQIEALGVDTEDAKELKKKLLGNAVAVNEKNAGELIKGYNRPDHPILELAEKVDKLNKDGMFAKLVNLFSKK